MNRAASAAALTLALFACGGGGEDPASKGEQVAQSEGCLSCHSTDGGERTGPSWQGLYLSDVELDDGTTITADEEYLRESILQPSARTVKGYREGLMATVIKPDSLSDEQVDALVAYIRSLR